MERRPGTIVRYQPSARPSPPRPDPAVQGVLAAAPLSATQRTAIQRRYGAHTAALLRTQPYRLVHEIPGLSFSTADTIARTLGTSKISPVRLQAGILAVLQQAIRQGHTGLPMPTVIRRATRLLGVLYPLVEEYCLRSVLAGGSAFVVEQHGTNTFFTSRAVRQVEERVAEMVADHMSMPLLPVTPHAEEQAAHVAAEIGLNTAQAAALRSTVRHPFTNVDQGSIRGMAAFTRGNKTINARPVDVPLSWFQKIMSSRRRSGRRLSDCCWSDERSSAVSAGGRTRPRKPWQGTEYRVLDLQEGSCDKT